MDRCSNYVGVDNSIFWRGKMKMVNCKNCKKNNTFFDCSQCNNGDEWEEIVIKRECETCQYKEGTMRFCDDCYGENNFQYWQPKETVKEEKEELNKYQKLAMLHALELDLYKTKNAKYGDSFGISIKKYGLISALTRMSDKFNRIETLILNHDNGTDDESLRDSLRDLANYCNMTIIEMEGEDE